MGKIDVSVMPEIRKERIKAQRLVSIKDAAYFIGCSENYIRQGIRSGRIPHIRTGKKYLINLPQLLTILDDECRASVSNTKMPDSATRNTNDIVSPDNTSKESVSDE